MAEEIKKHKFLSVIDDYIVITIGVALYTFAWADMLIPNGIASGGLTGACTILNFATGIPVYLSYIVVNTLLILGGTLVLGFRFCLRPFPLRLCEDSYAPPP